MNCTPYLFRKAVEVVTEVIHCLDDVFLIEMGVGVECHFDA